MRINLYRSIKFIKFKFAFIKFCSVIKNFRHFDTYGTYKLKIISLTIPLKNTLLKNIFTIYRKKGRIIFLKNSKDKLSIIYINY